MKKSHELGRMLIIKLAKILFAYVFEYLRTLCGSLHVLITAFMKRV